MTEDEMIEKQMEDIAAQDREIGDLKRQLAARPVSRKLPETRQAVNHTVMIAGYTIYINVGLFEDGTPGELFMKMDREGSTLGGLMDTVGIETSLALQHGVPLQLLVQKLSYQRFEPAGATSNPNIPTAVSPIDYVFRWLADVFLKVRVDSPENSEA